MIASRNETGTVATQQPRRVLLLSHAPITRSSNGWLTKNRVGMIADGLAECGWDVTVLATRAPALSFLTHPFSPAVQVVPFSPSPGHLVQVVRLLRESDAALVFMPVVRTALLALVLGRRALVYAGNAWSLIPGTRRWRWVLEAVVARRSAHVLTAGRAVYERFAEVTPNVSVCVPLVPAEVARRLRDGRTENKTGDRLHVLFVGTIAARKGIPELVSALRELPEVEARLIGPVADEELARGVHVELERLPHVSMTEYVEWADLREAYRWADVLVLPSHMEGFPRVLYEATAFGAAVVVTPVGGVPSSLVPGRDALFVPVGNASAITEALRGLANDRPRATVLAANARTALAEAFPDATPLAQFDRWLRGLAAGAA